jgi:hypothetical protein
MFVQGLGDRVQEVDGDHTQVGKAIILPATHTGSPRDMSNQFQDAMSLVRKYGKPDLFITMTCNPKWTEITGALSPGERPYSTVVYCSVL